MSKWFGVDAEIGYEVMLSEDSMTHLPDYTGDVYVTRWNPVSGSYPKPEKASVTVKTKLNKKFGFIDEKWHLPSGGGASCTFYVGGPWDNEVRLPYTFSI